MPSLLRALRGPDLAVDVGTSTVRAASSADPRVLQAPARFGGRPAMRGGAISDPDTALAVVRPLLRRVRHAGLLRPRVVASVPSDANGDERAALSRVLRRAGAAAVHIVAEPLAAAVGTGIDVGSPYAQMVTDIGHGVTDCAVFRSGAIVASAARRVGCGDLEEAVRGHVAERHRLQIDRQAATRLLLALRWAERPGGSGAMGVEGEGGGRRARIDLAALAEAVAPLYRAILAVPDDLCRRVASDLGAELIESGAWVTGGGSLLPGVVAAIAARTRLETRPVADPLSAVVRGNRRMIDTVDRLDAWG